MKKITLLLFLFIFYSCDNQESFNPSLDIQTYKEKQASILTSLNNMASFARTNGYKLNDAKAVLEVAQAFYSDKNNLVKFTTSFNRTIPNNGRVGSVDNFNESVANELQTALEDAETPEIYRTYLDAELEAYANATDLTDEQRTSAMDFIVYFGAYIDYVEANQDLLLPDLSNGRITHDDDECNWWCRWRCPIGSVVVGIGAGIASAGLEIVTLGTATPVVIGIVMAAGTWMIECG